jgi:hypothetical protein
MQAACDGRSNTVWSGCLGGGHWPTGDSSIAKQIFKEKRAFRQEVEEVHRVEDLRTDSLAFPSFARLVPA